MKTYAIVPSTHPALREVARPIPPEDIGTAHVKHLIRSMKALLAQEEFGVAIAAPQVGEAVRLFIVAGTITTKSKRTKDVREGVEEKDSVLDDLPQEDEVYINPELVKISRARSEKHEGCLSIRGKWGFVPRAEKATVRAYNERGEKFERGASGFLAHIFQHELDHLQGILYIDKANKLYDDPEYKG